MRSKQADYKRELKEYLSKCGWPTIGFHSVFARIPLAPNRTLGIPAALLLSQLVYWSDMGGRVDGWIYKSRRELTEETTLTRDQQQLALEKLEALKVVQTTQKGGPGNPLHYMINFQKLADCVCSVAVRETRNTGEGSTGKP